MPCRAAAARQVSAGSCTLHLDRGRISRTFLLLVDLASACEPSIPPPRKLRARATSHSAIFDQSRVSMAARTRVVCVRSPSDVVCRQCRALALDPDQFMLEKILASKKFPTGPPSTTPTLTLFTILTQFLRHHALLSWLCSLLSSECQIPSHEKRFVGRRIGLRRLARANRRANRLRRHRQRPGDHCQRLWVVGHPFLPQQGP